MIETDETGQMHFTDKSELSGWGFKFYCCHLNFRFRACFEKGHKGHLSHSGNYSVQIHSETRTGHDNNIQSNAPYK